jgi:hypothetical protein
MLGPVDSLHHRQQGDELVAGPGRIPGLPVQNASSCPAVSKAGSSGPDDRS